MWWLRIEFILYHAYILIFTFLPYGYLYLIVQTVGRASRAECSNTVKRLAVAPAGLAGLTVVAADLAGCSSQASSPAI